MAVYNSSVMEVESKEEGGPRAKPLKNCRILEISDEVLPCYCFQLVKR